jgi:hypothetical protein
MQPAHKVSAAIHTDVRALPGMLDALRANPPSEGGVLSAYLPVRPVQVAGQAYLVRFREAAKEIRATLAEAEREEQRVFEAAAARIEQYLSEEFDPRHPGLVVFAAEDPDYLFAVPLPARPALEVVWDPLPALATLEAVLDDHERIAVVLCDQRHSRLFTVFLGEIEASEEFESEDPGKRTVAGIAGNYARHHRNQILRHVRRTAHAAVELLRRRPFDRLLLGGPDETRTLLRDELPRPLRARLAGILSVSLSASDAEVAEAAVRASEQIERAVEMDLVNDLVASATMPRTTLGLRPTLDALNDGRVYHLFVADTFAQTGGECAACGWLVAGSDLCPHCGAQPVPLADLRERLVDRALEQGARVETVSGDAAAVLMAHDGLGGRTRY